MAIDFGTLLTEDQKRQLLEQRIQQFAAEGWQHQLNKVIAEKTGNEESIKVADEAIAIIADAISVNQAELDKINEGTL